MVSIAPSPSNPCNQRHMHGWRGMWMAWRFRDYKFGFKVQGLRFP